MLLDGDDPGTSDVNSMAAGCVPMPTYERSLVAEVGIALALAWCGWADSRLSPPCSLYSVPALCTLSLYSVRYSSQAFVVRKPGCLGVVSCRPPAKNNWR